MLCVVCQSFFFFFVFESIIFLDYELYWIRNRKKIRCVLIHTFGLKPDPPSPWLMAGWYIQPKSTRLDWRRWRGDTHSFSYAVATETVEKTHVTWRWWLLALAETVEKTHVMWRWWSFIAGFSRRRWDDCAELEGSYSLGFSFFFFFLF